MPHENDTPGPGAPTPSEPPPGGTSAVRRPDDGLESAGRRLAAYLRRLPLSETERFELGLAVLQELTAQKPPDPGPAAIRLLRARLAGRDLAPDPALRPPMRRGHMTPDIWPKRTKLGALATLFGFKDATPVLPSQGKTGREFLNLPWGKVARRRRLLLLLVMLLPTAAAVSVMGSFLPHRGASLLETAVLVVFSALFAWVSVGFWTATFGFFTMLRRYERVLVTRDMGKHEAEPRSGVLTALLFPVCNEDMERVMAGIRATCVSLHRAGRLDNFHVHILSDTQDPDAWVAEEAAFRRLRDELMAHGRLFYRRRRVNLKRKSGNVADFCRRHGQSYTYMVVMDADSVMTGSTLWRMVSIMERKRHVGILQTAPAVTGRQTYLARVQQFANRVYGPMYAAGLHFMQLGDAQFWGHNAIIRVKPFMRHCGLARLPGKPPLGGDIMSHDFVEAALMRRAGWGVWLAFDLEGSYEESPPTLLAELSRDRRWCQGNLQHMRLLFTRGLFPAHRALFLNGVMAYGSAFLWFLFLVLSSVEAVVEALATPDYFPFGKSLFPTWPVWNPGWALSLLATTGVILFLPKVESYLLWLIKGRTRYYGGALRMLASIVMEVATSTLLAPIRMLFHSKFVFITLLGRKAGWGKQQRDDSGTPWSDAIRFHLSGTILAAFWGAALFIYNRSFFWWITPILIPLLLAIPLSVVTSRADLGRLARRLGLFLTPEEVDPPRELTDLEDYHADNLRRAPALGIPKHQGFARAALDPATHLLHLGALGRPRCLAPAIRDRRAALAQKALEHGPAALTAREKKELLYDPAALASLHDAAWQLGDETLRRDWGVRLE